MKTLVQFEKDPLTPAQWKDLEMRIQRDKAGLEKSYTLEEAFAIIERHKKKRRR